MSDKLAACGTCKWYDLEAAKGGRDLCAAPKAVGWFNYRTGQWEVEHDDVRAPCQNINYKGRCTYWGPRELVLDLPEPPSGTTICGETPEMMDKQDAQAKEAMDKCTLDLGMWINNYEHISQFTGGKPVRATKAIRENYEAMLAKGVQPTHVVLPPVMIDNPARKPIVYPHRADPLKVIVGEPAFTVLSLPKDPA